MLSPKVTPMLAVFCSSCRVMSERRPVLTTPPGWSVMRDHGAYIYWCPDCTSPHMDDAA